MEYWNVYDRSGRWTGRTVPKGTPFGPASTIPPWRPGLSTAGESLLIQQRSRDCEILPGIWGMTTGRMTAPPPSKEGRPLSAPEADRGETTLEGCIREIREELGIQVEAGEICFLRRIFREELLWDLYLVRADLPLSRLTLQQGEVAAARWVTPAGLREMVEAGAFFFYPELWQVLEQVRELL